MCSFITGCSMYSCLLIIRTYISITTKFPINYYLVICYLPLSNASMYEVILIRFICKFSTSVDIYDIPMSEKFEILKFVSFFHIFCNFSNFRVISILGCCQKHHFILLHQRLIVAILMNVCFYLLFKKKLSLN